VISENGDVQVLPVFPVGRFVIWGAVLILLAKGLLAAIQSPDFVTGFGLVVFSIFWCSELIWGSKWARWIVGGGSLLWSANLLPFDSLRFDTLLMAAVNILLMLAIFFGVALLLHRQVGPYMESRRADTAARFGLLRIGVTMAAMVFIDVWKVTHSTT